jgi:hypothetical protein
MIDKQQVIDLYQLVLDREPESEQVIGEKRKSRSTAPVALEMLASDEFIKRNETLIRHVLHD